MYAKRNAPDEHDIWYNVGTYRDTSNLTKSDIQP